MKKLLLVLAFLIFTTSNAYTHDGRTDYCGGHNDQEKGGYHIQNFSKYCFCFPRSNICKSEKDEKQRPANGARLESGKRERT